MAAVVNAGFPNAPFVDPHSGDIMPVWRSFLVALFNRSGGGGAVGTAATVGALNNEVAARVAADVTLSGAVSSETTARAAADVTETTARVAADAALSARIGKLGASTEAGGVLLSWPAAANAAVIAGNYELALAWPWQSGSITGVTATVANGSFVIAVRINGVAVAGLGAVLVNSATVTTPAGLNTLLPGSNLTLFISAVTNGTAGGFTTDFAPADFYSGIAAPPTDATVQVNYTRSPV